MSERCAKNCARRVEEGFDVGSEVWRAWASERARLARSCQRPRPPRPLPRRRRDPADEAMCDARPRALRRRPQEQPAAAAQKPRGDAEPDHHRRPQVRHDEHPPLPRPPSRDPDVEAEGAQLLRRGAQLGPRPRLVREPLRQRASRSAASPRPTTRTCPASRACAGEDPRALPRRPPALHGARPDQADPLPLGARDRRRLRDRRDGRGPLRARTPPT